MPPSMRSTSDVIIRVRDLNQAVSFYRSTLGFATTYQGANLVGFDTGAFTLYLEQGAEPHGVVVEMLVPNVQLEKTRLVAEGCSVIEENAEVPRCYLRDPYGMVFNIKNTSA